MTTNLDSFLRSNAASYSEPESAPTAPSKSRATRTTVKAESNRAEVLPAKSAPVAETMPATGTLSAKDFILALRNAGRRSNDAGKMVYTDSVNERTDQKQAIAGYCGFIHSEPLGSQLDAARTRANRELRTQATPDTAKVYCRCSQSTVNGFVAGMPNAQQTLIRNLQKREEIAAEARDTAVAASRNNELSEETRAYQAQVAALEQARLNSIRADLKVQGYEPSNS